MDHLSIAASVVPRSYARFDTACRNQDWRCAAAIARQLRPLVLVLGREPDPALLKYALSRRRPNFGTDLRLPLVPISPSTARAIDEAMDGLDASPDIKAASTAADGA